jgi:hypothetical protein
VVQPTADHRLSPLNSKGKTQYLLFPFTEAPVSEGDNIIAIDRAQPETFDQYMQNKQQKQSHGRVAISVKGNSATFVGGNESGGVGETTFPLDNTGKFSEIEDSGRLKHPTYSSRYTALMKKVKVLGKDNLLRKFPMRTAIPLVLFGLGGYTTFKAWSTKK